MEGAGASKGFSGSISFWGSCWLEEGVGGIVGMSSGWLCPALFLLQRPEWLDSLGCLGQCAPGTALHHALAMKLLDPIPLVPSGHRDWWGVFVSLKLCSWESPCCPSKELQLCLGCGSSQAAPWADRASSDLCGWGSMPVREGML